MLMHKAVLFHDESGKTLNEKNESREKRGDGSSINKMGVSISVQFTDDKQQSVSF